MPGVLYIEETGTERLVWAIPGTVYLLELGFFDIVRKLEVITGKELAPKRPGRKPVNRK